MFVKIDESISSEVKLEDGKSHQMAGKGAVAIQMKACQTNIIKDIFYVPNLAQNLLSVSQLLEKYYKVEFNNDQCIIVDKQKNLIMAKIKMSTNKVFPLNMPLIEKIGLKSTIDEDCHLWHLRYGHLNYKGLNLLKKKNMIFGLQNIPDGDKTCEGCIYGKMHRLPFSKMSYRAKAPLEIINTDICGPIQTPSLNNNRYFLLFVDDYTRMMWVYNLKQKSDAFQSFLELKARVENQTGKKIKTLRTDRGGEFIEKAFMNYCKEKGIHWQLMVRYGPQQNEVAERKNHTIVEMARSMMTCKGLPKGF